MSVLSKSGATVAAVLLLTGIAMAQPVTKLAGDLDGELIEKIWCSSIFFEHSYAYEEGSEGYNRFDALAFDLDDEIAVTLRRMGWDQDRIDDLWVAFDDASFDLALEGESAFDPELEACLAAFD